MFPAKKTKIVCTLGPASQEQAVLERLIRAGINVARINFAHGELDTHREVIANVRKAAAAVGSSVAIMGDLPGPKMRIGELTIEPIELQRGQPFTIQTKPIVGDAQRVSLAFDRLPRVVKPGDHIFLNDGYIDLRVEQVKEEEVQCVVEVGGELRSRKGVNFPGIDLGIAAFTQHDHELLAFAAEQQLDAVSQSFVEGAEDLMAVRQAAAAMNYHPFLIAKLERATALQNLDAILQSADGIMVARGDLGVEIPVEEVALVQKRLIRRANRYGKPVITATHMLESMIRNRRPTRAEATDVANAIFDGTDCVMLSGETAIGDFPEKAVAVMTRIAQATEKHLMISSTIEQIMADEDGGLGLSLEDRTALSVYHSVRELEPAILFTPTKSGATARRLARFRLPTWIVALSRNPATCQQLHFSYGVEPLYVPDHDGPWEAYVRAWCKEQGITSGLALMTEGTSLTYPGGATHLHILYL